MAWSGLPPARSVTDDVLSKMDYYVEGVQEQAAEVGALMLSRDVSIAFGVRSEFRTRKSVWNQAPVRER